MQTTKQTDAYLRQPLPLSRNNDRGVKWLAGGGEKSPTDLRS